MPLFKVERPLVGKKRLFGGKLAAAVPAVVRVQPADDDHDPIDYDLEMTLDVVAGRMQCVRLCAVQRDGGPPVTTENLRRIPVGQLVHFAAFQMQLVRETIPVPDDPDALVVADEWRPPPANFASGGMTDEALEQLARVYRMALATGDRPYGVLEREFNLPRAKAARWISTARRRGILGVEDAD